VTRRHVAIGLQFVLLGGAIAAIVLTTRSSDWNPIGLFVALLLIAVTSDFLAIEAKGRRP
jgi:hypothetical protein